MTNRSERVCGVFLAASLVVFIGASTACLPKNNRGAKAANDDPKAQIDALNISRMEASRTKAMAAPGSASDAAEFAGRVASLHSDGAVARRNLPPTLVDDAAKCLDSAHAARPEEAPELLARKGELLLAAKRGDQAIGALKESMGLRPNLRAFEPLAKSYKEQNKTAEVEALCKQTLPTMKSDGQRYDLLDACIEYSGASTIDGGLRWAEAADIEFYKAKRGEIQAAQANHQDERRVKEAKEHEEFVQRSREKNKEIEGQMKEERACKRQCESVRSLCDSGCGQGGPCRSRCQSDASSCKRSCR